MTVRDLEFGTVNLLAEQVGSYKIENFLWVFFHSAIIKTGDNGEQEKKQKRLLRLGIRRFGLDNVHDNRFDLDKGKRDKLGVHGHQAEEEGGHRAGNHLPTHHPSAPHHLH